MLSWLSCVCVCVCVYMLACSIWCLAPGSAFHTKQPSAGTHKEEFFLPPGIYAQFHHDCKQWYVSSTRPAPAQLSETGVGTGAQQNGSSSSNGGGNGGGHGIGDRTSSFRIHRANTNSAESIRFAEVCGCVGSNHCVQWWSWQQHCSREREREREAADPQTQTYARIHTRISYSQITSHHMSFLTSRHSLEVCA